jgi:peptidyl-prolyl cis-trans isomerase SurA
MRHTRESLAALTVIILTLVLVGCSPKEHDVLVASVNKDPITIGEYERLYLKNNASRDAGAKMTQEERETFLNLLVKYRLKLSDAYREGLDRRPDVVSELLQYKGSLAASFSIERDIVAPGIRKLYDLRNEEIRASHILLSLSQNASAADSAAAYAKAFEIIAKLKAGEPFDSLAVLNSQDPSAKQNKGDLYYFTAGQMVPPFEQAAFSMKVGEISAVPVRTRFGLHIIKVMDRKPAPGEIHCSHIMASFTKPNPSPDDTLAAYAKILAVQDSLVKGYDFAELAKRNSGDLGSAPRGGDLGWFGRRRWVQPFDETAFLLKPGQRSAVIRTSYGYHIISCLEARPRKTFDEAKDETKQLYMQTRFQDDYAAYMAALKKEVRFHSSDSVITLFFAALDTMKTTRDSGWASGVTPELGRAAMFTVMSGPVSTDSVIAIVRSRPDLANTPLRSAQVRSMLDKIADQLCFASKADDLERKNPDFAAIMKEYKEGILLYQIEQDRVWNRVNLSDSSLHHYFDSHRDRFVFPDRVNVTQVRSNTQEQTMFVRAQLDKGKSIEECVREDSIRMSAPLSFPVRFTAKSATLSAAAKKSLAPMIRELVADPGLTVRLTVRPDTSTQRRASEALAGRRLDAVAKYMAKEAGLADTRLTRVTRALPAAAQGKADTAKAGLTLTAELVGRQARIAGKPETLILPTATDERTRKADSLAVGAYTAPIYFNGAWVIVRLNSRDAARQKSFEEAGPEVSSLFQDAESKRLEKEWIAGLRRDFPVVEHPELLNKAFAPEH